MGHRTDATTRKRSEFGMYRVVDGRIIEFSGAAGNVELVSQLTG